MANRSLQTLGPKWQPSACCAPTSSASMPCEPSTAGFSGSRCDRRHRPPVLEALGPGLGAGRMSAGTTPNTETWPRRSATTIAEMGIRRRHCTRDSKTAGLVWHGHPWPPSACGRRSPQRTIPCPFLTHPAAGRTAATEVEPERRVLSVRPACDHAVMLPPALGRRFSVGGRGCPFFAASSAPATLPRAAVWVRVVLFGRNGEHRALIGAGSASPTCPPRGDAPATARHRPRRVISHRFCS